MPCIAVAFCAVLLSQPSAGVQATQESLLDAATSGNVRRVAALLAEGADANQRGDFGRTPLMLAAAAGNFPVCRELLWAGADANAKDEAGFSALEQIAVPTDSNLPLRALLRAYAYLQVEGRRATERPKFPSLVMIMEDTVNYLHPRVQAAYKINRLEAIGATGQDDDKNGFVDDVFGWTPVGNKPFVIRQAQLDAYLKYREAIGRIIQIDNDRVEGRLDPLEAELRLADCTNPLSDIMGPMEELSDGKFLEMLKGSAHGSHVAGIVLDASEGKATLHTLAMDFPEASRRPLGPDSQRIVDQLHAESSDPDIVLAGLRARLLSVNTERGRLASRYLRTIGAGIANMSFGGGIGYWKRVAERHINRCQEDCLRLDPAAQLDEDVDELVEHWGLELYVADAVEHCLMFYENPDVLFVISAGNEDRNNDTSYTKPAYLSRFFPNVVTVASTRDDDTISDFSNYGVWSVDIGAPGENILSTVIPEASVYMSGTSMAAPYVAGVAALMRSLAPKTTATELKRLMAYTARDVEQLHRFVSSGGVIDKSCLRGVVEGSPQERSETQARIALNAALLGDDLYPRHAADAHAAAEQALALDRTNPAAWRAKSLVLSQDGDLRQALEAIDRAVELGPDSEPAWMDRALLQGQLGQHKAMFESIAKAIEILAAQGEACHALRARHLALRAGLRLKLDQRDEAASDARLARELNPAIELPESLEALL
jgi:hypothetical protein